MVVSWGQGQAKGLHVMACVSCGIAVAVPRNQHQCSKGRLGWIASLFLLHWATHWSGKCVAARMCFVFSKHWTMSCGYCGNVRAVCRLRNRLNDYAVNIKSRDLCSVDLCQCQFQHFHQWNQWLKIEKKEEQTDSKRILCGLDEMSRAGKSQLPVPSSVLYFLSNTQFSIQTWHLGVTLHVPGL